MGRKWTDEQRKAQSISFATPPLCPMCGETEPTKFYIHKSRGTRSNAYCSECHKIRCRKRYHSKSMLQKRAERASLYGLSVDAYLDMHSKQDGKCAICYKPPMTQRGLHVDHCHKTGIVRGLLCHGCNIGIGNFDHNPILMESAIKYLRGE